MASEDLKNKHFSTKLIHGADHIARVPDVTPPINITTTFRYDKDPSKYVKAADLKEEDILHTDVYSRITHPNGRELEETIGGLTGGHAVVYNSGLSAFFAALTYFNPKTLSIGQAYHGCHGIVDLFKRIKNLKQIGLDGDYSELQRGDIVHLETPVNPEGVNLDIAKYAEKAHARGAILIVDSTFAPPPLQDPFKQGADIVMHSATKYFGGHSDLLAGVLVAKDPKIKYGLVLDRECLGTNIASLECSLLIRSIKTLELRVRKQSENAAALVKYLHENKDKYKKLATITHGTLQDDEFIKNQLPNGQAAVFSMELSEEQQAREFPSKLKLFHHATSLGGIESLVEWRALSDSHTSPRLIRVSVGIEDIRDLIQDFDQALR